MFKYLVDYLGLGEKSVKLLNIKTFWYIAQTFKKDSAEYSTLH